MAGTKKTHWFRIFVIVMIGAFVAGTVLSAVLFRINPSKIYARATLQLTFDGAADGTAPNGRAYSIRDLTSDEVIGLALERSSLGDRITPDELRASLYIQGNYPSDIVTQAMSYESLLDFAINREVKYDIYHPTQFTVILYNDFSLKQGELTGLLDNVMNAYKEVFTAKYSATVSLTIGDDVFEADSLEYAQRIDLMRTTVSQLALYAREMAAKDATLRVDGIGGFSDVAVRLQSLMDNELESLNARISTDALSADANRLISQYNYQISVYGNQRDAQKKRLESLNELIGTYEKQKSEVIYLSTADSLTKIDGNSSQTYDALINLRKATEETITQIDARINDYETKIRNLNRYSGEASDADDPDAADAVTAVSPEDAERKKAEFEAAFSAAGAKRDAAVADFRTLLDRYNAREINDDTVAVASARYFAPRYLSSAFALKVVRTAGPVCAVALIVFLAVLVISRRREEKELLK